MAPIRHGLYAWKGWNEINSSGISCAAAATRVFITTLLHYRDQTGKKKNSPHSAPTLKCTKWMPSPAGNTCQDYNKGCILSPHPHLPPLIISPTEVLVPFCCICIFTHKYKHADTHAREPKHTLVPIETLWHSCGGATISQLTEHTAVWPPQKCVCVCVLQQ